MGTFPPPTCDRRVLVVVGPESTGTRAFTEMLSAHPAVMGTPDARTHGDLLDPVWRAVADGDRGAAAERLAEHAHQGLLVTRRSLPHGPRPGAAAAYGQFPPVESFLEVVEESGRQPVLLITTRSPLANVVSWARERASVRNDPDAALKQYAAAYRLLFGLCARGTFPFYLLSLEALALEGAAYVGSLFSLLGLPPADPPCEIQKRGDVNLRRYQDPWVMGDPPSVPP